MSKDVMTGVYDFQVPVKGCPASAEEYNEMAKQEGACLDTAVDNDIQHNWKGSYRKSLREGLVAAGVPTEDGEKDKTHYNRAKALIVEGSIDGLDMSGLVELRNSIADTVTYSTGGGSSSRIGEAWLNKADKYLENIQDPASWTAFMENISAANPGFTFECGDDGVTPTRDSVALALKTEDVRVRAAAETGLFAAG